MLLDGFFWGLLGWLLLWLGSFPHSLPSYRPKKAETLLLWNVSVNGLHVFQPRDCLGGGEKCLEITWTPSTNSENSWFLLDCYGNWASTARRILNLGIFRGYVYYVLLAQILPRCLGNTEISRVQKMSTKCPKSPTELVTRFHRAILAGLYSAPSGFSALEKPQVWSKFGRKSWSTLCGSYIPKNHGKSPCLMGKSTISTGPSIPCRFLYVSQRVMVQKTAPYEWSMVANLIPLHKVAV